MWIQGHESRLKIQTPHSKSWLKFWLNSQSTDFWLQTQSLDPWLQTLNPDWKAGLTVFDSLLFYSFLVKFCSVLFHSIKASFKLKTIIVVSTHSILYCILRSTHCQLTFITLKYRLLRNITLRAAWSLITITHSLLLIACAIQIRATVVAALV